MIRFRQYSQSEIDAVRSAYQSGSKSPAKDAAGNTVRSVQSVRAQAAKMGLTQQMGWTAAEDAQLCRVYYQSTKAQLVKTFGRAANTIYRRARQLGITRNAG